MMRSLTQGGSLRQAADSVNFAPSAAAAQPALQAFWNDLAQADSKRVSTVFIGHSMIEGVHSTSVNKTIASCFRDELRNRWQPTGIAGGFGYSTRTVVSYFTDDPLTASGGTWVSGYGLGRKSYEMTASGANLTWTGITCTGADIYYLQWSGGGTAYWSVDGGTQTTFSTANSTQYGGGVIQIRGLTPGTHTIKVGWTSGTVFVNGLDILNGDETTGIHTYVSATSSTQSSYFIDTGSANIAWLDTVNAIQPSLVVIADMTNDPGANPTGIPSATTKSNLTTLIADVKAKCTVAPSFVLCTEYQANSGTFLEPWGNYVAAAKSIAQADPTVAIFDVGQRFGPGPFTGTPPLVYSDLIHPNNAGAKLWGKALASFVSPR